MEVTLELSCCKYPPADELPQFWDDNRASLLQFLGEAHRGVKGFVKDENAIPIEGAAMKVRRPYFDLIKVCFSFDKIKNETFIQNFEF